MWFRFFVKHLTVDLNACFKRFFCIIPGTTARGHGNRHEQAGHDHADQQRAQRRRRAVAVWVGGQPRRSEVCLAEYGGEVVVAPSFAARQFLPSPTSPFLFISNGSA